ncbi:PadR family transcriptional regulator, partial [Bacillus sp. JR_15]
MTDLYILGLISMKPMSGYDVEQNLKNTMVDRWGGILVGSIYYALNKLEKGNYIKVCETRTVGKKSTKIYKITELGKEHKKECVM